MKTFGYNQEYNILIMDLLGPSLENLFQTKNKKFSLKTTCMIGIQMIDRIEYIHSRKVIHRDIKPDNFTIGKGHKSHIVYILDFGLAKKYWSSTHKCHIPFTTGKRLTGTARYASINALSGYEQSRRDDLESIAYILLYFLRGSLPWQGLRINNKDDRYKKICDKKRATSARELLKSILKKNHTPYDFYFDWNKEKPDIDENDIIYTNDYHIEYNGKNEWLNRKSEISFSNTGKSDKKKKNRINVYSKPVFAINQVPTFKNSKTITSLNINLQHLKTSDNSYYGSKINNTNYKSSRKNIWK